MQRRLIGGDLKSPKCRRWWSNSRIGGAGNMPLGYITLLSGKGVRFDENETQTHILFFVVVTIVFVLFRFGFS
jgi:hypothetical protein